ncbi:MAG: DUF6065 family protein [Phycisphaerales bacterium]
MTCELIAHPVSNTANWSIEPAGGRRDWMDQTPEKFAYRCLPLVMANHAGWIVRSPLTFSAIWNGKQDTRSVTLKFPDGEGMNMNQIRGHFGAGVITFSLPWLFRTSPGYGLWVRGPTNAIKDNLIPLDGIVETDWAPYSFTMNWRVMRRNTEVYFRKGDEIALLTPYPLALLESVQPRFESLDANPVLKQDFERFTADRAANIRKISETNQTSWSMDYMRGHRPDGTEVTAHRKAWQLRPFA